MELMRRMKMWETNSVYSVKSELGKMINWRIKRFNREFTGKNGENEEEIW